MPERLVAAITKAAAEFVSRESNGRSLVTITRTTLDENGTHVTIYFSVFPDKDTHAVQDFLARRMTDFVTFMRSRIETRAIPRIRFLPEPNKNAIEEPTE
jgi:ribosome-binding factor A